MTVSLTINGEEREFEVDPRRSLLDLLRKECHLTGAKSVCGEGFCGACTVHVDGEAVPSCLLPVGSLAGKAIVTVEGVTSMGTLNDVQQAFIDHDVVQCGMCFPGMVMTFSALLKTNPEPSRSDVKAAMVGNICRCTGYERIVDAVMSLKPSVQDTAS